MAKPMTVTTRSDSRKQSTEQARQGKYRPTGATSVQEDVRFQRGAVISLDQSLVSKWSHNGLRRVAYSITLSARARIGSSLFDMASIDFQLPTFCAPTVAPSAMSASRDSPRHMTMLPGGGSFALAR